VTALPADPQYQDPLDPERILRELPERERRVTYRPRLEQPVLRQTPG
jgi:hypothetical protein